MLFDSVAPLVKITSLGSAPIRSATCCKNRKSNKVLKPEYKRDSLGPFTLWCKRCFQGSPKMTNNDPELKAGKYLHKKKYSYIYFFSISFHLDLVILGGKKWKPNHF